MARYEWQERRGGRRYVRIADGTPSASRGGKVIVPPADAAEAEAVPEVKIEAKDDQVTGPKRGRPKKADAPVVIEDDSDE